MSKPNDVEELREDIARTRAEVAETVDALVAKTEVRRRLGEKAHEARDALGEKVKVAGAAVDTARNKVTATARDAMGAARRSPRTTAAVAGGVAVLTAVLIRVIAS